MPLQQDVTNSNLTGRLNYELDATCMLYYTLIQRISFPQKRSAVNTFSNNYVAEMLAIPRSLFSAGVANINK